MSEETQLAADQTDMAQTAEKRDKFVMNFDTTERPDRPPQEYYDAIKAKFAEERDLRLGYRPPGTDMYRDLDGAMADLGYLQVTRDSKQHGVAA